MGWPKGKPRGKRTPRLALVKDPQREIYDYCREILDTALKAGEMNHVYRFLVVYRKLRGK